MTEKDDIVLSAIILLPIYDAPFDGVFEMVKEALEMADVQITPIGVEANSPEYWPTLEAKLGATDIVVADFTSVVEGAYIPHPDILVMTTLARYTMRRDVLLLQGADDNAPLPVAWKNFAVLRYNIADQTSLRKMVTRKAIEMAAHIRERMVNEDAQREWERKHPKEIGRGKPSSHTEFKTAQGISSDLDADGLEAQLEEQRRQEAILRERAKKRILLGKEEGESAKDSAQSTRKVFIAKGLQGHQALQKAMGAIDKEAQELLKGKGKLQAPTPDASSDSTEQQRFELNTEEDEDTGDDMDAEAGGEPDAKGEGDADQAEGAPKRSRLMELAEKMRERESGELASTPAAPKPKDNSGFDLDSLDLGGDAPAKVQKNPRLKGEEASPPPAARPDAEDDEEEVDIDVSDLLSDVKRKEAFRKKKKKKKKKKKVSPEVREGQGFLFNRRNKDESYELKKFPFTIGRVPGNSIQVEHPVIAKLHVTINQEGTNYLLKPGNEGLTFVNGEKVVEPRRLLHDDVLTLGRSKDHPDGGAEYLFRQKIQ